MVHVKCQNPWISKTVNMQCIGSLGHGGSPYIQYIVELTQQYVARVFRKPATHSRFIAESVTR